MDNFKANQLEGLLRGRTFKSYRIEKLLNNGKSATVFLAINDTGEKVAIKIFDNEMIERFGHEIQQVRIEKEISLKGHNIPGLVKILDGGKEIIESEEYYFIIMDYIDGINLKQFIESSNYDNSFVQKITNILLDVSEKLLDISIVHRDIKPENIMIENVSNEVILMDLGVLKLIGVVSISDMEEKQFVGTLRYAPPEFLLRNEKDTVEGWRAINLYQIGGVLHDLIMKAELFHDRQPYSNLVLAIKEDAPIISNLIYPFETIQLSRDLLSKDPTVRLNLCKIERIKDFASKDFGNKTSLEKELEAIFNTSIVHRTKMDEIEKINRSNKEKAEKRHEISEKIIASIDTSIEKIKRAGLFFKTTKSKTFFSEVDRHLLNQNAVKQILYKIEGDLVNGFIKPLYLLIHIVTNEMAFSTISSTVFVLGALTKANIEEPLKLLTEIQREKDTASRQSVYNRLVNDNLVNYHVQLDRRMIFNGTFDGDDQWQENIAIEIVKLMNMALADAEPEVRIELERREKFAQNLGGHVYINSSVRQTKLFF